LSDRSTGHRVVLDEVPPTAWTAGWENLSDLMARCSPPTLTTSDLDEDDD
jgi:hypothetical protein